MQVLARGGLGARLSVAGEGLRVLASASIAFVAAPGRPADQPCPWSLCPALGSPASLAQDLSCHSTDGPCLCGILEFDLGFGGRGPRSLGTRPASSTGEQHVLLDTPQPQFPLL